MGMPHFILFKKATLYLYILAGVIERAECSPSIALLFFSSTLIDVFMVQLGTAVIFDFYGIVNYLNGKVSFTTPTRAGAFHKMYV